MFLDTLEICYKNNCVPQSKNRRMPVLQNEKYKNVILLGGNPLPGFAFGIIYKLALSANPASFCYAKTGKDLFGKP